MTTSRCVLLADRHHALAEGVRGLLETAFESVFIVADEASLLKGARRLRPAVAIVDIALAEGDLSGLLSRVTARSPRSKVVILSVHDEPCVAQSVLRAGAHAVVLKRSIATDLLPAVERVLKGERYVSPALDR